MEGMPVRYRVKAGTRHARLIEMIEQRNERVRKGLVSDAVGVNAWIKLPRQLAQIAEAEALIGYASDTLGSQTTSGRPTFWAESLPDPTALARHESRVTRSKKGSAIKVTRRAEHRYITGAFDRTAEGLPVVEDASAWLDPDRETWPAVPVVIGPDESRAARLRGERRERARIERKLIAAADAILSRSGMARHEYRLTDAPWLQGKRGEMRQQVVDGGAVPSSERKVRTLKDGTRKAGALYRGSRGCDAWSIPVPDDERNLAWCDFHGKHADRCTCQVSARATVGSVAWRNEGSAPTDNGTSLKGDWSARQTYPANVKPERLNGVELVATIKDPNTGHKRKVYGAQTEATTVIPHSSGEHTAHDGALVTRLVAYGPHGAWLGHDRADVKAGRDQTRVTRKALAKSAQTLAERRSEITRAILAILNDPTVGLATLPGTDVVLTREPGKRTMTYRAVIGTTTHSARTPSALADKVARTLATV